MRAREHCRCAYDSSGSFLAAAPNIPDAATAWSFPTQTSAAWDSGHSWALLFTQQAQHEAFRGVSLFVLPDPTPLPLGCKTMPQHVTRLAVFCGAWRHPVPLPNSSAGLWLAHVVNTCPPLVPPDTESAGCLLAAAALLVEWQAATKARQSLSADGKSSSEDSGASAETDTSRAFQARSLPQSPWVSLWPNCGLSCSSATLPYKKSVHGSQSSTCSMNPPAC